MTDLEYQNRAEALLRAIEAECDRINESTDADIDNQRVGGMVTLVFADRSQIVVNRRAPGRLPLQAGQWPVARHQVGR